MLDPQIAYKQLLDAAEKGETDRLVQEDFFARIAHLTLDGEPLIEKQDPHDHYTPLICAAKLNHSKCVALLCTVGKASPVLFFPETVPSNHSRARPVIPHMAENSAQNPCPSLVRE